MDVPLFRPEVQAAKGSRFAGHVVLARPLPMKIAVAFSLVMTSLLICFLAFGEYTRKVHVSGQLIPTTGTIRVVAPQFGRVIARHVRDGERVTAGQVLYELTSEREANFGSVDMRIEKSLAERRELLDQERSIQQQQSLQRQKTLEAHEQLIAEEISGIDQEIFAKGQI